jgi:hypothetical protein
MLGAVRSAAEPSAEEPNHFAISFSGEGVLANASLQVTVASGSKGSNGAFDAETLLPLPLLVLWPLWRRRAIGCRP